MTRMLFLISGRTGCGKSALTEALSTKHGFPTASFGDAVRSQARYLELDASDKGILQKIGQKMVDENPEILCRSVLDSLPADWNGAFIEGLRHQKIYETLKSTFGSCYVRLIFVNLDPPLRFQRLAQFRGWSEKKCKAYDDDPTEIELEGFLRQSADYNVDNGVPLNMTADLCSDWIIDQLA